MTEPAVLEDLADPPATVLIMVAHPDDIDFGFAGTAAALTAAGSRVVYRLATSGEAGGPDDLDRAELKATREAEQRAAAAAVGVDDVEFLGLADGHLEYNLHLRVAISRVIRETKPDLMLTQSPERRYDRIFASHPDHLAVGAAAMAAAYPDSRNPHFCPDRLGDLEPHTVPELWMVSLEPVDVFVDITAVIDQKVAALSSHASQISFIDDVEKFLRGWGGDVAAAHGFPDGTLVEGFRRIRTV